MQDIEFTVQDGTLYLLQTRSGKRSARAAVKVARDLVNEHVIDQHTALLRVRPQEVNEAIRPVFDDRDKAAAINKGRLLARGLPAAPGAAVGKAVFDADRAVEWAHANEKVILVRAETSPRTWRACTPPRASSPRERPDVARGVVAVGWARPVWSAPGRSSWTSIAACSRSAVASSARATGSPSTAEAARSFSTP